MVSQRLEGWTTRSCTPGSTPGAASFSASSSGTSASSESQSQPPSHGPSVQYSQPRPTGGAMLAIESNASAEEPMASKPGIILTRCWVVRVPARSA